MCGIIGKVGPGFPLTDLKDHLVELSYRGYDSSGIAYIENSNISTNKTLGDPKHLIVENMITTAGIGHTRWATHGAVTIDNCHPHHSAGVYVVHNGIIENYAILRSMLEGKGFKFISDTDSEVIPHLIRDYLNEGLDIKESILASCSLLRGAYAIVVMYDHTPGSLYAIKHCSNLMIGEKYDGYIVTSSFTKSAPTKSIQNWDDDVLAEVTKDYVKLINADNPVMEDYEGKYEDSGLGTFSHYMQKEIMTQSESFINFSAGRLSNKDIKLSGLESIFENVQDCRSIWIIACGTSYNAGMLGKYYFERFNSIPIHVEHASEFIYREPAISDKDVVIVISQSGETADTIAAVKLAKSSGSYVYGITNSINSTIARLSDTGTYLHIGTEVGVASTKAFTMTSILLYMMAVKWRSLSTGVEIDKGILKELLWIPNLITSILRDEDKIKVWASKFTFANYIMYLGRGYMYPITLEGSLKLKEVSYIHTDAYPGGEMKHGSIALIDSITPVVLLATQRDADKILSNAREIHSRGGRLFTIAFSSDHYDELYRISDNIIRIPNMQDEIAPIIVNIMLQMLAYHVSLNRGCDVDKPRNLAKSVTVE